MSFMYETCSITTFSSLAYFFLLLAGWATGLSAGEGEWTLDYSFFKVSIDLTDAGHGGFLYYIFIFILRSSQQSFLC